MSHPFHRPFRMARTAVAVLLLAALGLGSLVAAAGPAGAASPVEEQAFVAAINQLRAAKGLRPLAVEPTLSTVARAWADKLAADGALSHRTSLAAGVSADWSRLGENVGVGHRVDSLFDAFVKSPAHYANLVQPDFTHVGVGVTVRDGKLYTAHEFMARRSAPAPAPAPARAPAPAPAAVVRRTPPAPTATVQPRPTTPVQRPATRRSARLTRPVRPARTPVVQPLMPSPEQVRARLLSSVLAQLRSLDR